MARRCAGVGALVRRSVGKGAQMCASSCVDLWVKESGGWKMDGRVRAVCS